MASTSKILVGLSAFFFFSIAASAAPVTTPTPVQILAQASPGSLQIVGSQSLGAMIPRRVMPSKIGGGILVFSNGLNLVVRRLPTIASTPAYAFKDTVITSKIAGKAIELKVVEEDAQGNVFVFSFTPDGLNKNIRLLKIDPQGAIAFDLSMPPVTTRGCFELTPDGSGGVYTMSYAIPLAQVTINGGRPKITRISATGAQLWENIAPTDYTYHANSCALARAANGAYAAFSFVPDGNLDSPGEIHFVNVSDSGALVGVTDKIAIGATGGLSTVTTSLSLDAEQMWNINGPVLLGKTKDNKHYFVRYDAQNKPVGSIQEGFFGDSGQDPREYQGSLYKVSGATTVDKFQVTSAGFTKTSVTIKDVASKPEHLFTGMKSDGKGTFVYYGKIANTTFPVMGIAKIDGTKSGSFAASSGLPFGTPFETILVENGNFLLVDTGNGQVVATNGKFTLPSSGAARTQLPNLGGLVR